MNVNEGAEPQRKSIPCPKCNSIRNTVKDSRAKEDRIRRRRECAGCSQRFTTYEVYDTTFREMETLRNLKVRLKSFRELLRGL